MMRARERAKRNEDRKEEENLANGVPSNASSTIRVRKIRSEESWCDSVGGGEIGTCERDEIEN